MTSDTLKGRVRLYACGGGGINVGHRFEQHRGVPSLGFAAIEPVYIDTSDSNLHAGIPSEHLYRLKGLDGSGKLRRENAQAITERVRDILNAHTPGDVNIVLSTAAGGSGSVIAPSLVSELLDLELPTIVIAIGSAETKIDAENTLKTLKSYEAMAMKRQAPVVIAYYENGEGLPRSKVDSKVESLIISLCALYSRQNRELDSQDLFNFLRFNRVTSFGPMIAALSLVDSESSLEGLGNVISVATLAASSDNTRFPVLPEYQCVGFVPEGIDQVVVKHVPLHFVTSDGILTEASKQLDDLLKQLESNQKSRPRAARVLSNTDSATDTGLVL